jgi:Skp family chaperone for outer membrane proteins
MKLLYQICLCTLLITLTGAAWSAILLVRAATVAVTAIPAEVAATRTALLSEVQASRRDLIQRSDRQLTALRRDVLSEARELRETADRRTGDTLARADTALATIDSFRRDVQPVLQSAESTLQDTRKTVADLHPQLLGLVAASKVTAGETAQTMRDVRHAVPGFLAQSLAISSNVQLATLRFSGVADNLNRLTKPKWYDRLIGYGLNGVVIYRNLNPVTNLTLKGAQILSSRP